MTKKTINMLLAVFLTITLGTACAQNNTERTRMSEDWGTKKTKKAKEDTSARMSRIIVVPAIYAGKDRSRFMREKAEKLGFSDRSIIETPGYTSFLIDALTNTNTVDVLEREDLLSVVKELDFGESDYTDPKKVAQLGDMLNADYVVIPEIRDIKFSEKTKIIPYIGKSKTKYILKLATSVRTVDVRTSRLVSSHISEVKVIKSINSADLSAGVHMGDMLSDAYRKSSTAEAAIVALKAADR